MVVVLFTSFTVIFVVIVPVVVVARYFPFPTPNSSIHQSQVIRTKSKITANHAGWFEFALCEIKNNQPATEACLRPLVSTSVERRPKYAERPETKWELFMADGLGEFDVDIQLPAGFTCDHCVLRWLWNCGEISEDVDVQTGRQTDRSTD